MGIKRILLVAGAIVVIIFVLLSYRAGERQWFRIDSSDDITSYTPDSVQKMIDALAGLESVGSATATPNPKAINWLDRDGTASFGCLQFKPTSFKLYGIRYGFFGENVSWDWLMTKIFDCELEKQIARAMILDPAVDKSHEWPTMWPKVKGL